MFKPCKEIVWSLLKIARLAKQKAVAVAVVTVCWSCRCLWKNKSFYTSLCPAKQQQKVLSSPWCAVFVWVNCPKGILIWSCFFTDTNMNSYQTTGTGTWKHFKSTFKHMFFLLRYRVVFIKLSGLGVRVVWKLLTIWMIRERPSRRRPRRRSGGLRPLLFSWLLLALFVLSLQFIWLLLLLLLSLLLLLLCLALVLVLVWLVLWCYYHIAIKLSLYCFNITCMLHCYVISVIIIIIIIIIMYYYCMF